MQLLRLFQTSFWLLMHLSIMRVLIILLLNLLVKKLITPINWRLNTVDARGSRLRAPNERLKCLASLPSVPGGALIGIQASHGGGTPKTPMFFKSVEHDRKLIEEKKFQRL